LSRQQTIKAPVELRGRGLFHGLPVTVRFKPAPADAGIVFVRLDQPEVVRIPASIENVVRRPRRTSLRNGTTCVETVEHCLAACAGLGIDNVEIEVDGPEMPDLDGSCHDLVQALQQVGVDEQTEERRVLRVSDPVRVAEGDAELVALPPLPGQPDRLGILYELDYGAERPIPRQLFRFELDPEEFAANVAPARTYLFSDEAKEFQAAGLGRHLSHRDLLVVDEQGQAIENELRFPDEYVRHKVLDLLGDLMLLGQPVVGRIHARKSGHSLNRRLVSRLAELAQAAEVGRLVAASSVLDIRRIQRVLPHRYPFLLIDRVVKLEGDRRAVGIKNVSMNEEFFQGHYPGQPIMPGVLILEAMAQLAGILLAQKLEHTGKVAVLLSMDRVKFRRAVVPGDQLVLEAEAIRIKPRTGHVLCRGRVGQALAAEAVIKFMMVDADPG
jgi:UDP-3-O-[3-hydroxymyristoyl] N-acetylglucosamine deacetylase/3-hydroxyacyl-[acyl-carrier-protein] dehydratase